MRHAGLISPYEDLGFGIIRRASDEFVLAVGAFVGTNGWMVEGMGAPIGFPTGIGSDGIDWSVRSTTVV